MTALRVPPIPTPTAVAGASLLGDLHAALCRYVVLPSPQAADAVTLWVAATHAQPAWEHAPAWPSSARSSAAARAACWTWWPRRAGRR